MPARCLETRRRSDGLRYRRYSDGGVTFWTVEVPVSVFRSALNQKRLQPRLAGWQREHEREKVRARAAELLQEGWKPLAVAHELGIDPKNVYRVRDKINE